LGYIEGIETEYFPMANKSSGNGAASGADKHSAHSSVRKIKSLVGIVLVVFVVAAVVLGVIESADELASAAGVIGAAFAVAILSAPLLDWLFLTPARRGLYGTLAAPDISAVSVTDSLTQLMNRRGVTMGLLEAMAQAERYDTPLSVALVDVDGFQRVNEEFGNSAGDKVLAELAGVLAETLRMPDKIGRFDGEEFLAVLPHTSLTEARKIGERLRNTAGSSKFSADGKRVPLTVSLGVTQFAKGEDLEQLLSRAQNAVREAKKSSGNHVIARKSAR
jgi:diguanylate cyclase (GGDEF)-like protein